MTYKIIRKHRSLIGEICIVSSKSESNRALIIKALSKNDISIDNLSNSDDTVILSDALRLISNFKADSSDNILTVDIGNCGTAMRFLTAFLAITKGDFFLTGSERMKQRPISILVDALNHLGADISYAEKNGFPPLKIKGASLQRDSIEISSNISSQFISALLLIAPVLPNGLRIILKDKIISMPYLNMTLQMMKDCGIVYNWNGDIIEIEPQNYLPKQIIIGGDWSAASYWFEMAAFATEVNFKINGLLKHGLQGDEIVSDLFECFGIKTDYLENGVLLNRQNKLIERFNFDFTSNPDLAQTLGVTCAGLNIECKLDGLDNLTLKECNRIEALCLELTNIGFYSINSENKSIIIKPSELILSIDQEIKTYNDHRMALSFAPLAMRFGEIKIKNPEVVNKSYPDFWNELKKIGFTIIEDLS